MLGVRVGGTPWQSCPRGLGAPVYRPEEAESPWQGVCEEPWRAAGRQHLGLSHSPAPPQPSPALPNADLGLRQYPLRASLPSGESQDSGEDEGSDHIFGIHNAAWNSLGTALTLPFPLPVSTGVGLEQTPAAVTWQRAPVSLLLPPWCLLPGPAPGAAPPPLPLRLCA